MSNQGDQSEVARVLERIREEYEAAIRGLSGIAEGTTRHAFITTRMENMGNLQTKLDQLVGDNAIALIVQTLDPVPDQNTISS